MIVGTLTVSRADANWAKLHAALSTVLGSVGYSHDGLPGPVRVLADAPVGAGALERAQAVIDAHDPAPTTEQQERDEDRRLGSMLPPRLIAALTLRAWPDATAAERTWAAGVIAQAGGKIREARA